MSDISVIADRNVATITIDRQAKRNAIDLAACHAIADAVEAAVGDGARVVIVTGAGGHFCAGADLTGVEDDGFRAAIRRTLDTLRAAHARNAPKVTTEVLSRIVGEVPEEWRGDHDYAGYLAERIAVVGRWLDAIDGLDSTGSATTGPGTGGLPRGPEARKGLGPRVGAPKPHGGVDAR